MVKNLPAKDLRDGGESLGRRIPWRRAWQSISVFLPGEFQGRRRSKETGQPETSQGATGWRDAAGVLQADSTPERSASPGWTHRPHLGCCLRAHIRRDTGRVWAPRRARKLWTRGRVCTHVHTHKHVIYRRLASRAHAAPRLQPRAGSRIARRLHSGDGQHPKLQNCILKLQAKGGVGTGIAEAGTV